MSDHSLQDIQDALKGDVGATLRVEVVDPWVAFCAREFTRLLELTKAGKDNSTKEHHKVLNECAMTFAMMVAVFHQCNGVSLQNCLLALDGIFEKVEPLYVEIYRDMARRGLVAEKHKNGFDPFEEYSEENFPLDEFQHLTPEEDRPVPWWVYPITGLLLLFACVGVYATVQTIW